MHPRAYHRGLSVRTAAALLMTMLPSLVPSPAPGQAIPAPGSRIRFLTTDADTALVGRLVTIDASALVWESPEGSNVRLNSASIVSLEVARTRRRTRAGLGIGALSGAFVLGLVAAATYEEPDCRQTLFCFRIIDQGEATALGALTGALGGGLLGALIGHSITSEEWEPFALPSPTEDSGALSLGVRLRF